MPTTSSYLEELGDGGKRSAGLTAPKGCGSCGVGRWNWPVTWPHLRIGQVAENVESATPPVPSLWSLTSIHLQAFVPKRHLPGMLPHLCWRSGSLGISSLVVGPPDSAGSEQPKATPWSCYGPSWRKLTPHQKQCGALASAFLFGLSLLVCRVGMGTASGSKCHSGQVS